METDDDDSGSGDCGNVLCQVGYTLNPDTCKCEKNNSGSSEDDTENTKGTWTRDITGARRCENGSVVYKESPVYPDASWAGRTCSTIGDVRYVVLTTYSCGVGLGSNNLNWMVADMNKYVCK